jgi:RHS repeat-associated protein
MRRSTHKTVNPDVPFLVRHRRLSALAVVCLTLTGVCPVFAGGYVDGNTVLNPAKSINTGGVSVLPTFNNDQFNDQLLVGTVNNDAIRTPSTADPVSTVSGNNYHDETDFVIRGRNGLNFVFTRTYNSAPSSTKADRGLGYGWVHSYMMRLKSNDFGDCPNCTSAQKPENGNAKTSSITYTDERGGEQNYLVNETTYAVTAPKGVYDTLMLDFPVAGQHMLTFRNGTRYIFETPTGTLKTTPNVIARLKTIDDAWGDRLTLTYDANGRLSTVTDNLGIAGRTGITFTYDANGRLKDVTDWTARKWSFAYDASGNLQTLTNPLLQVLTYGYDAPKHLLASISKPVLRGGMMVQTKFKYYENGRTFQQTNSFDAGDTLDYDLYRKSTRVTDARGFVREYFYDENGRMTKLVEPDGGVLLFENQGDAIRSKKYDALGYATTYSYRLDRAFTGTSDANGNVTREQDALNRTTDITYDSLDQVASVKDKRGTTSTTIIGAAVSGCDYTYRPKETRISALSGSINVLLASQCWNGNATLNYSRQYLSATRYRETRLTYAAGSNGLNVSQAQIVGMPSGVTITKTYTYDSLGRKKTETLKRRTSPTNPALMDITTRYDYDALDRVIKVTDSLGNEVINNYDANGQLWKVTHRYKNPDATYDERDVVTRTFDAADRVKTETDAEGNISTYSYDDAGNVIAVLDAEGHTTRFEYDAMNRRTAAIDATGYRTETQYTLRGDVVGIKNANDETVKLEIDALGRKTATVDAKGNRTELTYDPNGNLICVIDANAQAGLQPKNTLGCTESRQYDELNRITKITDALNGETSFTYDLAGNRLTVKDAENKTWSFAYDDLGRLTSETDHSANTIAYKPDEAGNVYEKTNRLGEITRYTFDTGNRLTRVDYLKDGSAETFGYDAASNRNAAANSVVSYGFTWDRLNRLTGKTDSRGRSLSFTYDNVGNLLTKTTYQGSTTSYVYNAANRLVMLQNPDYTQVDYQYDPAGRLLSRVTANGARTTYQYDTNGWLTHLAQYDAANALVSDIGYSRDHLGNLLTAFDVAGGPVTGVLYEQVQFISGTRTDTASFPAGPGGEAIFSLTDFAFPNAFIALSAQIQDASGQTVASLPAPGSTSFTVAEGARYTVTVTGQAGGTLNLGNYGVGVGGPGYSSLSAYTYDALYRLTSADSSGTANDELFTYDKVGNRKSYTKGSLTPNANTRYYNYTANTNRLSNIRIGATSGTLESGFTHDSEGRLTSQTGVGAKTLTWDAKGRLWTLTEAAGTEAFAYDPMDYRIGRSSSLLGSRDYFLEGEHLESVYQSDVLEAKYFRGSSTDELVAAWMKDADGKLNPFLFHHDQVNSVSAVSGHNGTTLQSTTYSAFGSTRATTGTSPNWLKYTGREDDGTGLYYYRARYYDPVLGRFVSEDPMGFGAGVNFYAYANNNPVNFNDPMGLEVGDWWDIPANVERARQIAQSTLADSQNLALNMAGGDRNAANNLLLNGQVDAWRHAEWMRRTSDEIGPVYAWTIGVAHEAEGIYDKAAGYDPRLNQITWGDVFQESLMDLSNNRLGITEHIQGTLSTDLNDPRLTFGVGGLHGQPEITFSNYVLTEAFQPGAAGGGFLLYPNKANLNMMHSVYAK